MVCSLLLIILLLQLDVFLKDYLNSAATAGPDVEFNLEEPHGTEIGWSVAPSALKSWIPGSIIYLVKKQVWLSQWPSCPQQCVFSQPSFRKGCQNLMLWGAQTTSRMCSVLSALCDCGEQNINLSSKRTHKKSVCQVAFFLGWESKGTLLFVVV